MFSLVFLGAVGRNLIFSNLDQLFQEYVWNFFLQLQKEIGVPVKVLYEFQAHLQIL